MCHSIRCWLCACVSGDIDGLRLLCWFWRWLRDWLWLRLGLRLWTRLWRRLRDWLWLRLRRIRRRKLCDGVLCLWLNSNNRLIKGQPVAVCQTKGAVIRDLVAPPPSSTLALLTTGKRRDIDVFNEASRLVRPAHKGGHRHH